MAVRRYLVISAGSNSGPLQIIEPGSSVPSREQSQCSAASQVFPSAHGKKNQGSPRPPPQARGKFDGSVLLTAGGCFAAMCPQPMVGGTCRSIITTLLLLSSTCPHHEAASSRRGYPE